MRRTESNIDSDAETDCEGDVPERVPIPSNTDALEDTQAIPDYRIVRQETPSSSQHLQNMETISTTTSPARPSTSAALRGRVAKRRRRARRGQATMPNYDQVLTFFIEEMTRQRDPLALYTRSLLPHLRSVPVERLPYLKIDIMRLIAAYNEGWPMAYNPIMRRSGREGIPPPISHNVQAG